MTTKFAHINIVAEDWKRLAQFYIDVFGCRPKPPERDLSGAWVDKLTGLDNARLRGMHLVVPGYGDAGPTIEIFQFDPDGEKTIPSINRKGFAHIAFAVDDVEACLKLLLEKGGSLYGEVVQNRTEGVGLLTAVYAMDPDGNIIEIQKWE